MSERWIFVDDTNPGFQYGPGWTADNITIGSNQLAADPLYGTLHVVAFPGGNPVQSSLSYSFNATYIAALFPDTSFDSIVACTIDGIQQEVYLDSTITTCHNIQTLSAGVHRLEVIVNTTNQTSVLFDGLYLHSMYETVSDVDIQIHIDDPSINAYFLQNMGDTLNFDFVGYSMSFYVYFNDTYNHAPSNAVYSIDESPPVNVTVNNVASATIPAVGHQILIQTPRYPLGPHNFNLKFLGTSETVPIRMNNIVVQNSTGSGDFNLEIIPPIPLTVSSSSSAQGVPSSTLLSTSFTLPPLVTNTGLVQPSNKSNNPGIIAGSVIAGLVLLVILILGVLFIRRRHPRTRYEVGTVELIHTGGTAEFRSAEAGDLGNSVRLSKYTQAHDQLEIPRFSSGPIIEEM